MKARVKLTGVLVDVTPKVNVNAQHSGDNLYECDGMIFRECELDFLNIGDLAIDWEQRRYELARAAMQGILSNTETTRYACYTNTNCPEKSMAITNYAIACADALINKLRK